MLRSFFSGLSGLKAHQVRLDVISNNVSNVNTYGYKASRVSFQDLISQMLQGASEPKVERGGINPKQVGFGVSVASIDKIFTQGAIQTTGKNTDLAIQGDGFFILREGDNLLYTRAGNFGVDKDGYLVNPSNGMRVQGWMSRVDNTGNRVIDTAGEIEDIKIPIYGKEPAKATNEVVFKSNLISATEVLPPNADANTIRRLTHRTSIDIYDAEGNRYRLTTTFWKVRNNTWQVSTFIDGAVPGSIRANVVPPQGVADRENTSSRFIIGFSPNGILQYAGDDTTPDVQNNGKLYVNIRFQLPNEPVPRTIRLFLGTAGLADGITQFSSQTTTKAVSQDGYPMGYLESFTIDDKGTIVGIYSNGKRVKLAQVALALFTNPAGLEKYGENAYIKSPNSGEPIVGEAGIAGRGKIISGALEMSNVDLADQFTDMIITQRGFQANSRSITTSDQILQEVLGLKR
jgi:flagellar hook protein FlgE